MGPGFDVNRFLVSHKEAYLRGEDSQIGKKQVEKERLEEIKIQKTMYKIILKNGMKLPETFANLAEVEKRVKMLGLTGHTIKSVL